METDRDDEGADGRFSRSSLGKIVTIGVLVVVFLIPLSMVQSMVGDREEQSLIAQRTVTEQWGDEQTIVGPVLHLTYRESAVSGFTTDPEKGATKSIHLLPEEFDLRGTVDPEIRYRGIYQVALYRSDLALRGHFNFDKLNEYLDGHPGVEIEEVLLTVGVSDVHGIEKEFAVSWGGETLSVSPGARFKSVTGNGLTAVLGRDREQFRKGNIEFHIPLQFKGAKSLRIAPVGNHTTVTLRSPWNSPSFTGRLLPSSREISSDGFEARWDISGYSRNMPQLLEGERKIEELFGVRLHQSLDHYHLTERAIKYAALFLLLTFGVIFVMETIYGLNLHLVNYLFVGSALVLYYLLLLSLSEHIAFGAAYLVASVAITLQIGLYDGAIMKSRRHGLSVGAVIAFLYGMLFMLLQTEAYTILIGSIGLFVIISIAMYATRNINWYGLGKE